MMYVNCFLSHKGQLTKCAREHVRLASTMEQIAAETWRDAIDEVVEAAQHDQALRQRAQAQPPEAVANAEDSEAVQAEPAASVAPVFHNKLNKQPVRLPIYHR